MVSAQSDWLTHTDPSGFAIDYPPNWTLEIDEEFNSVYIYAPDGASFVLARTYPTPDGLSAEQCTIDWYNTMAETLSQVETTATPNITQDNDGYTTGILAYTYLRESDAMPMVGLISCTLDTQNTLVYLAFTPSALVDATAPTLVGIGDSLRLTSDGGTPQNQNQNQPGGDAAPFGGQQNNDAGTGEKGNPFEGIGQPAPAQPQGNSQQGNNQQGNSQQGGSSFPFSTDNNANQAQPAQPQTDTSFINWTDPFENAFTTQIPDGWTVEGGIADVLGVKRVSYTILSPDETVLIDVGNPDMGYFLQPDPQNGLQAGLMIMESGGMTVGVAEYMTGAEAAAALIETSIASLCESYQLDSQTDIPDQSGFTADETQFFSAGEITFTCVIEGTQTVGYYYGVTIATNDANFGPVWYIDTTFGFIAVPERVEEAAGVLAQTLGTFQYNPAWLDTQARMIYQPANYLDESALADPSYFQFASQMMSWGHDLNMSILNNMGDGGWTYEWQWDWE